MDFDFSKLIGRIGERYKTRTAFAAAVGMSDPALSYKLNNKTQFSVDEIYLICQPDKLDIPPAEIATYFFTPLVR